MTRASVGVALGKAQGFVASRPDWFLDRLSTTNITNLRAIVTMFLALWTAWRYFMQAKLGFWQPSVEWLAFLVALGGLDVVQYGVKRRTWQGANAAVPNQDVPPKGPDDSPS